MTTLYNFSGADGDSPMAPMILASDGNFYGITQNGGPNNSGTIFKVTPNGTLTTMHTFGAGDGTYSTGPLVQASDGNFYGTTELGGTGSGSIFKMTMSGNFRVFYSFNSTDGSAPASGLVLGTDRNLYGTTYEGGSSTNCPNGCGTVFKITTKGTLTTLHNFDLDHGSNPIGGLTLATDGNFYGTTYGGGTSGGWGTVFKMTASGTVTTLHSFQGTDGAQPYGPVTQSTGGNLHGTATNGTGGASLGTIFDIFTKSGPVCRLCEQYREG